MASLPTPIVKPEAICQRTRSREVSIALALLVVSIFIDYVDRAAIKHCDSGISKSARIMLSARGADAN